MEDLRTLHEISSFEHSKSVTIKVIKSSKFKSNRIQN